MKKKILFLSLFLVYVLNHLNAFSFIKCNDFQIMKEKLKDLQKRSFKKEKNTYTKEKFIKNNPYLDIIEKPLISIENMIFMMNSFLYNKKTKNPKLLLQHNLLKKDEIKNLNKNATKGLVSQMIVRLLKLENKNLGYKLYLSNRYAYTISKYYGFFTKKSENARQYIPTNQFMQIMNTLRNLLLNNKF